MKGTIRFLLCVLLQGLTHAWAQGDLRLPAILGDHMVLQQSADVKLWGWCPSVWKIRIVCGWASSDTVVTTPGRGNGWTAVVRTPPKGGPYTIRIIGDKETREIRDVLIGEVWLCSGQSNMEYAVKWGVSDAGDALNAPDNPEIRWFQTAHASASHPLDDLPGVWRVCNKADLQEFSAVAYFFGRRLQAKLGAPVGLIGSYWGGTAVQPWTPGEVYAQDPALGRLADRIQPSWAPVARSVIYNAMIHPLTKMRLAGVIWYQGESNNEEPEDYGRLFSGMILGWRAAFQQELPFYFVQIAPWSGYRGINGALLREQQQAALRLPRTGMAVTGDLVSDVKELHPRAKRAVGERLAALALKERYGLPGIRPYAPGLAGFSIHDHRVVVTFSSAGRLRSKDREIGGFQLAGADSVFYSAVAKMEKDGSLSVSSANVASPLAVRYCFTNDGCPGLFDSTGLPLLPFRTDRFGTAPGLRFHGHRFKILQFTDLHWIEGGGFRKGNDSALELMRFLLTTERPDLVVFTGDIVVSRDAAAGWKNVIRPLEELQVPFAVAFGNHDTETDLTKTQVLDILRASPYNVTYNADPAISGVGNCALPVRDEEGREDKWVLYLFDSHAYAPDSLVKGYDWIHNDQVQWYRRQSSFYTSVNGKPLPSLAFFHIPLPEFATVSHLPSTVGNRGEEVCAPAVNSGLFTSFVEMGDVRGVFAGHDHNNDFAGVLDDICLGYGRKTGYNAPYPETLEKGARVIQLDEDDGRIDTYIRTLSGTSNYLSFKKAGVPIANGTFIQNSLAAGWDDRRWQQEFSALKEVGMHYIVLAPVLHTGKDGVSTAVYPCGLPGVKREYSADLVENCLRNAKKAGFKVFLGLNFNERWWNADFSAGWLDGQMEQGNRVADELVRRYKRRYDSTLYGWYWVWEVDNLNCKTAARQEALAAALNTNIDHLQKITPSMPFMLCPFMNYRVGTPAECRQMWTYVFARTHFRAGDIFAPQDGIGAGGLDLDKLPEWYAALRAAVNTRPGLIFWSDAETFDQRSWTIAPLDRFVRQMQLVQPYVSDVISFAYSHYYSPYKVDSAYHDAYRYYTRHGELPVVPAPAPVTGLSMGGDSAEPVLSWRAPVVREGIAGYYIYRNGQLVGNNQYSRDGKCRMSYAEKAPPAKGICRYEVEAYTVTGVVSARKGIVWARDGFIHNGVIAHRGAWKKYAVSENSLGSLKNAIGLGCEGSEFDVWMSADSVIVISHDPVIGGKTIEETPAAELAAVSLKNGEHVPTLQQYLALIKTQHGTRLFLEIKSSGVSQERSLALTDRVVRMVHDNHAEAWVSYISFNFGVLRRVLELDPRAETAYLGGDKTIAELKAAGMSGLDYPYFSFHTDTAITANGRLAGLNVNVWTVDSEEEMRFLLNQGVDRITTNEPGLLLDMLAKE